MKIDTKDVNPAFQSIVQDPCQKIFLDANFFIPPDRSQIPKIRPYSFDDFRENWLIPLLTEFSGLSIHESVYDELVEKRIKTFADVQIKRTPATLKIHYDSELSKTEEALRNLYISKLAVRSKYDPSRDNTKDRGEIRSLSFMAVKQYVYFAANDALPIRLIKESEKLCTGLNDMKIIQMYELIYFLYGTGKYNNSGLRILYKYQYHLTRRDKDDNPEWGCFIREMDNLYSLNK